MARSGAQEQDAITGTGHQSLSRGRTPAGAGQDGRGRPGWQGPASGRGQGRQRLDIGYTPGDFSCKKMY